MGELEQERVLKEVMGKDRKRTLLVQAVSSLRQGKALEALVALNNLIACFRALPGESLSWSSAKEQDSATRASRALPCRREDTAWTSSVRFLSLLMTSLSTRSCSSSRMPMSLGICLSIASRSKAPVPVATAA